MTNESLVENELLRELADVFVDLEPHIRKPVADNDVLQFICNQAVKVVPAAVAAGVTCGRGGRFATVAATGDLPERVDAIQYELGSGPSVDAVVQQTVFNVADLSTEGRWPEFGRRAVTETGVVSMLSFRMYLEDTSGLLAGLNLYSPVAKAFDDKDQLIGLLLSTHGALALTSAEHAETIEQLRAAVRSNRRIGAACGILMANHKVTEQQAFDLLRIASQHTHRKLYDIAIDVVETGQLELPDGPVRHRPPH
ncbi:MAG: hypothetical protein JWN95_1265 [Frankiales bacterium]|nr:hypothetical protein [Frankiales bacterium]